jgi:hypothetical protein
MGFDNPVQPAKMGAEQDWLKRRPNLIATIEDI